MIYEARLWIPKNTPKVAPAETTIEIEDDFIPRIGVFFPKGQRNLVYAAVFYGRKQLSPSPKGTWLTGENALIWDDVNYVVPTKPCTLTLKGCSPGTRFGHEAIFYIEGVTLPASPSERYLAQILDILQAMGEMLGVG